MLSILIPTYNYPCSQLANRLSDVIDSQKLACEIIVCDDASNESVQVRNRCIAKIPHCTYLELSSNIGRSRIRNYLAEQAKGDWLLFIDCDGMPMDDFFLSRYIQETASGKAEVVCGGIIHPEELPSPEQSLRYYYEKKAEPKHCAAARNKHPYSAFRSFNFLIRRDLFMHIKFDEAFKQYGYEDVLLGLQLKEMGVDIHHIENPLINCDIEDNQTFIRKTEEALRTLAANSEKLGNSVRLHDWYEKCCLWKLTPLLRFIFGMAQNSMRKQLTSHKPYIPLFNLYKLGYYATIMK
ncbi:MAG: glycosyltransferase family 2 protein [Bacteroidaceae bacterium]|nr:glycosyltransferase family 2 protein [Bacteroidaceae bacterium]